ncbi:MAG: GntR family transcriptional regulator, partial [Alphaproteobacteria bacterium]|nr:GntR family transcriptional regulator [Alphaproteobacteria bacterium]
MNCMTNNPYRLGWVPDLTAYPRRPVYAAIADAMADAINSGKLQAGMKLPPRRLLAYTLGLNLGTVHKAYALAARKGLVSGETGRGTFVRGPLSKGVSWPNENPYERRIDFCDNYPCLIRHADPIRKQLSRLASDPELDYLLQYQQNSALGRHKLTAVSWLKRFRIDADPDQTILT